MFIRQRAAMQFIGEVTDKKNLSTQLQGFHKVKDDFS